MSNITYRTIDPETLQVRDQGLYNPRLPSDRNHVQRVFRKAHAAGLMVMTMETGRQEAMFNGNNAEFTQAMTGTEV